MRLLIDVGNTRIKWARQTDTGLSRSDAVVYTLATLANELAVIWGELDPPQDIWVSCVGRKAVKEIIDAYLMTRWGISANYVQSPRAALGVTNAYSDPGKLGSDRWLAMLATYTREERCVMVVDCGSAVTIDAVDETGRHVGGAIAPGIALSNNILSNQTSLQWQPTAGLLLDKVLADSTASGIASGIGYAVIGLIEVAYRELVASGKHPVVYLTGGDAACISHALTIEHQQVDDLVLQGLAMFANHA